LVSAFVNIATYRKPETTLEARVLPNWVQLGSSVSEKLGVWLRNEIRRDKFLDGSISQTRPIFCWNLVCWCRLMQVTRSRMDKNTLPVKWRISDAA